MYQFTSPLRVLQHSERILSQNFPDASLPMPAPEQALRKERKLRRVFHPGGHECTVEIRPDTDMIRAGNSDGMIDMFDDFLPTHLRQFSGADGFIAQTLQFH